MTFLVYAMGYFLAAMSFKTDPETGYAHLVRTGRFDTQTPIELNMAGIHHLAAIAGCHFEGEARGDDYDPDKAVGPVLIGPKKRRFDMLGANPVRPMDICRALNEERLAPFALSTEAEQEELVKYLKANEDVGDNRMMTGIMQLSVMQLSIFAGDSI